MADDNKHKHLSEEQRKEIFLAPVDAQDHEMGVAQSRQQVRHRFGVTDSEIRQIESEGIEQQWPPL
jgi:hypothetical protein